MSETDILCIRHVCGHDDDWSITETMTGTGLPRNLAIAALLADAPGQECYACHFARAHVMTLIDSTSVRRGH